MHNYYRYIANIQIHNRNNTIDDVLLDGYISVNIIIEQLKVMLSLRKLPKLAPYNLRMVDQTTTELLGLIWDLWMYMYVIFHI